MRALLAVALTAVVSCGKAPVDPGPIAWASDLDAARDRAVREDRVVLVWADATWDTAGKELERVTFRNPQVRAKLARSFVLVHIDATDDESREYQRLADRFDIVGVPTMIFLSPDMSAELGRFNEFVRPEDLNPALDHCVEVAQAWRMSSTPAQRPYPPRPTGLRSHWKGCG